jgi:hypothetical protein
MKVLSPFVHGIIDYAVGILLLLAPVLFGFDGAPEALCYALGVGHIGYSLLTRYPLSIVKLIPFPIHGMIESAAGVFLLASPWLFGFADDQIAARNFFVGSAIAVGLVVVLTRYRTTPAEETARGRVVDTTTPLGAR